MATSAQKEIVQEATHRAKAAVEDARDQVKEHMSELQSIETKLQAAREQNVRPDRAEIEALEARLKEIQLSMSQTVEAASKEVAEATSDAKSKIGHDAPTDSKVQPVSSVELERQDTGAQDVLAPASLTDKYSATSPRPSPQPSSGTALPRTVPHAEGDELKREDSGSTPTSARASQGIVGGFLFHPSTSGGVESEEDEESETPGPSSDEVTASVDQAAASVNTATAINKAVVEDVRDKLEHQSLEN